MLLVGEMGGGLLGGSGGGRRGDDLLVERSESITAGESFFCITSDFSIKLGELSSEEMEVDEVLTEVGVALLVPGVVLSGDFMTIVGASFLVSMEGVTGGVMISLGVGTLSALLSVLGFSGNFLTGGVALLKVVGVVLLSADEVFLTKL